MISERVSGFRAVWSDFLLPAAVFLNLITCLA